MNNEYKAGNKEVVLYEEWNNLEKTPPNEFVEVKDADGNVAFAQPTYCPFEVVRKEGDEKKEWGWRGTPVFYEDRIERWDGGWMISIGMNNLNKFGSVIGWRAIKKD